MREIVATATRGHHERDRLLRLSGASTVPFKVSAATRGSNLVLAGIFPPAFFFQAVLTPESDNRLTRLRCWHSKDRPFPLELGNLLFVKTMLAQHFTGMLAVNRRARTNLARRF